VLTFAQLAQAWERRALRQRAAQEPG
jgi:hypothetical protein